MEAEISQTLPLACVPGAIPAEERPAHFGLIQRLFRDQVRERRELAEGYVFRFDPGSFGDVARFVDNERRCCPFLSFALTVAPPAGAVWLELSGPEGTRAFLDAELPH